MEILCWSKMWKITTLFWILFWTRNSNVLGDECWSHWEIKTLICLLRLRYFWAPEIPQWNFHLTFVPGIMSKSHAKTVWGPQNLPKDRRSWGRFCRSPNSLHMGFTFLMDANTSKYFYNYFMGMKQTLISHWKIKKISAKKTKT